MLFFEFNSEEAADKAFWSIVYFDVPTNMDTYLISQDGYISKFTEVRQ